MPGPFGWLSRRRLSQRRAPAGARHANYETTLAAAARRMPATYPIGYEEALAAPRLPQHPPGYEEVVNEWHYRYPARTDANGNAIGPPPRYDENSERAADAGTPPSYAQATADAVSALETEIRNFSQSLSVHLKKEFLLPFPGEAEISEAGGSRTQRGSEMAVVRSVRLARQSERLAAYRRGLIQLRERIDQLSGQLEDPDISERLRGAHAVAMTEYGSYESVHEREGPSGMGMLSLAHGDVPFERWGKEQGWQLLREAVALYDRMRIDLMSAFSRPLPRAQGVMAHIALPRARRNELRYERATRLHEQHVLLRNYRERMDRIRNQRGRQEALLRMNPELWDDLGVVLAEIEEFYLPFWGEYDRQAR